MTKAKKRAAPAQEGLETRQGKCQPLAHEGGQARDPEKGEVQGPACGRERDETRSSADD